MIVRLFNKTSHVITLHYTDGGSVDIVPKTTQNIDIDKVTPESKYYFGNGLEGKGRVKTEEQPEVVEPVIQTQPEFPVEEVKITTPPKKTKKISKTL